MGISAKKITALSKSNYRCAHCGKVNTKLTLEHIFPKSLFIDEMYKENEYNLVSLCSECNRLKDDTLVNPTDFKKFYKYISKSDMNEYYNFYIARLYDFADSRTRRKVDKTNNRLKNENAELKGEVKRLKETIKVMFSSIVKW